MKSKEEKRESLVDLGGGGEEQISVQKKFMRNLFSGRSLSLSLHDEPRLRLRRD